MQAETYSASVMTSRKIWRFLLVSYLPMFGAVNLLWETLQLPLYTIWHDEDRGALLFAVLHCTAGDMLIGGLTLITAVMLFGRAEWPRSRHIPVLAAAASLGVAYTIASEWINTRITLNWQYTDAMPELPPFGTGLTPLLQWVLIPPAVYAFAVARDRVRTRTREKEHKTRAR